MKRKTTEFGICCLFVAGKQVLDHTKPERVDSKKSKKSHQREGKVCGGVGRRERGGRMRAKGRCDVWSPTMTSFACFIFRPRGVVP